jgi:nitrate reductase molybdenum cofactor assembly chaperone NarJ/NarW
MTPSFKALGALLSYPTPELVEALPEIVAVIEADAKLGKREKRRLGILIEQLGAGDLLELQEGYVDLFDRGRSTSLNLFEHVHGESRDRGPAMVDLMQVYDRAGLRLTASELPDYLPAMLEFLSQRPFEEAREMLDDCAHILRALGETLLRRQSPYASVFAVLLEMIGEPGLMSGAPVPAEAKERTMDEEWAEEPVIFGPEAAPGCGSAKPQVAVMRFVPKQA